MAETVEFELVSPERLLLAEQVAMVVVPGTDGDFGVLPRHAPLISTVRPGVIAVYKSRAEVSERIFVAGGFAEVTGERCTVLAEEAMPVGQIDREAVAQQLRDLAEDVADAKSDPDRRAAEAALAVAQAKQAAARSI
ncbi:MAG: F0F1 ATP synthase subunit epsilon [Inquilinus sp.]|nr:F0F1 ATP synthase subunit epsilon [Inquilinus sp.]